VRSTCPPVSPEPVDGIAIDARHEQQLEQGPGIEHTGDEPVDVIAEDAQELTVVSERHGSWRRAGARQDVSRVV